MLSNLLSGLIGAVIGGILSYFGAIKSAEKSASILFSQDIKRRNYEKKEKETSIVNRLIGEINENIELAGQHQVSHAKIKFITEAWSLAKGNIYFLDEKTQNQLQRTYVNVHKYNALVDYDSLKVDYGRGYLDDELTKLVMATRGEFVESLKLLKIKSTEDLGNT